MKGRMAGCGRRRGAAAGAARAAVAALLGLLLAVVLPGAAWARLEFNESDFIPIDSSRFFRDVISSDEAWMVVFLAGNEKDRPFLDNIVEGITEIKNLGRLMPKIGFVNMISDSDRVVANKLDLMEDLPSCQGFLVKKDKDAMTELAARDFAEEGADLERDFVQYYKEWAEEFPRANEEDTVVMKHKPVDKPGKDGDL